jgi:hypothetical protein
VSLYIIILINTNTAGVSSRASGAFFFFDPRPIASTLPHIRVPIVLALQVLAGGLEELERPEGDARDLPPDRTMLGRSFWTYIHR